MYCTEMSLNSSKLFVVDYVEQIHLETTLLSSSGCDILCILSTTKENVELLMILGVEERTDCSISARKLEVVASYLFKGVLVKQFACSVPAASEKHSEVTGEGE